MENAQLQALQYVQNKFGRESLVLGGRRFRVKNRYNDRVYWRCSIPACPATVNTHQGHPVKFGLPHNHPANQPKIEVMKVMQTMKQRAKAEVTPIPTIYEEELIRHTTKRTTTSPGLYDESSFTTSTTAPRWRRVPQPTWRHRRRWQLTRHNIVHRLCDRALGWRTPLFMEPLPDRGTQHHQPPGRMGQQDQEESSSCPPKHLPDHRGTTEYPGIYRMYHHPVRSRRCSPTKETQIQSDRHQTQVPARTHQRGRRSIPSPSLGLKVCDFWLIL